MTSNREKRIAAGLLPARQAADMAGLTYRQLDYLRSAGVFTPEVTGGARSHTWCSPADVERLRVCRDLLSLGIRHEFIRDVLRDGCVQSGRVTLRIVREDQ